jgi:hypothetical protein
MHVEDHCAIPFLEAEKNGPSFGLSLQGSLGAISSSMMYLVMVNDDLGRPGRIPSSSIMTRMRSKGHAILRSPV